MPAPPYVELHCASAYSLRRAGSGVEALVARAAALGMTALALTDYMTLAGMVQFQAHCARHGIRALAGVELAVAEPVFGATAQPAHLVVLAENATGYARLCQLLTDTNLAHPAVPVIPFGNSPRSPAMNRSCRPSTLRRCSRRSPHPAASARASRCSPTPTHSPP